MGSRFILDSMGRDHYHVPGQVEPNLEMTHNPADDWDSHWQAYSDVASSNPAQMMRHELVFALLMEERERVPHARLLDIGCGQGDFLAGALRRKLASQYAGIELSESGVEISRAKLPGVDISQVDLLAQQPEAERLHGWATTAVCTDVIEHVDDDVGFLTAARRFLIPGGRLAITVPSGPMSAFDRHIGHRRHYSADRLRRTLENAGFAVDRVFRAGFPFFNLYRLLVIARGPKLISAVESGALGRGGRGIEKWAMQSFRFLFGFNRADSRFGWQLVALARA
jgi:SAM-dependent methyltransferase